MSTPAPAPHDWPSWSREIKAWGITLGFQEIGIADTDLTRESVWLNEWLAKGMHGGMDYMVRGAAHRAAPDTIVPGTVRVVTARLNYVAPDARESWDVIDDPSSAFISRYALGRDYHKVLRGKLKTLAQKIEAEIPGAVTRVFTDSAPVMEVALAQKAGLGWRGKHTLLLNRRAGSLFFLGEIYVNLPLTEDAPTTEHCGTCTRCIDVCPTQAIVAPYVVDARRCISYLTIEHPGEIPIEFREAMGNRIYGCDDCQLVCPWNKYAHITTESDFAIRHGLDDVSLVSLWSWTESEWPRRMEGTAIRRIGFERWQRNLAVASGNALRAMRDDIARTSLRRALVEARTKATALVSAHIDWALAR
jgi:epoxyqueuosine reductase